MAYEPVRLDDEQREECVRTIREVVELANAKVASGRSSMPIYVSDVRVLVGLAAAYLDHPDSHIRADSTVNGERS